MVARKQIKGEYRKELGQDTSPKDMFPVTYFLPLDPTSYFSLPPNSDIIL
jgi:hypothetical protein